MSSSTRLGLMLVACALVWGGFWQFVPAQVKEGGADTRKWEYKSELMGTDFNAAKDLDVYGEKGWELVCVTHIAPHTLAYFKRPK